MRQTLLTTALLCVAVTTAAQAREPTAKGGAKPKPLVSGSSRATSGSTPAPAPAEHTPAVAHGEAKPAAAAAAAPATKGLVAPAAPAAKGPVALAKVLGRLTAALAGLHEEPARGRRAAPVPPRYTVIWPAARWRVAWRDDADRVVVSWPEH